MRYLKLAGMIWFGGLIGMGVFFSHKSIEPLVITALGNDNQIEKREKDSGIEKNFEEIQRMIFENPQNTPPHIDCPSMRQNQVAEISL